MNIKTTEHIARSIVITPEGRVDAYSAPELRKHLARMLDDGINRFVMDLSTVTFMDSAGMAALVSLLKRSREAGGDVKLVWPKEEGGQRILRLTKFDRVFEISETAEAALQAF